MTDHETTIRWRDPEEGLALLPHLDGIEYLKRMVTGEVPAAPMAAHIQMDLIDVDHGSATFRCHPDRSH